MTVRPRYGRLLALGASLAVTVVAVLGGVGVLPVSDQVPGGPGAAAAALEPVTREPEPTTAPAGQQPGLPREPRSGRASAVASAEPVEDTALPARSGQGRRVVFSESRQRVWLVGADGPLRSYPVSGSVYDNLDPGTYEVYSRSRQAWGIDDSGTMRWFVRFTQGENAAIGFHDIPVDDGRRVQGVDELGTPLSHGCIRQRPVDARALWDFAPLGTAVVVTA